MASSEEDDDEEEIFEEELEFNNNENDEDDSEVQSLKRRKVDEMENREEPKASTLLVAAQQELDKEKCRLEGHPAFIKEMCVRCAQYVKDESAVAFGYIHKDLKIGNEEMARLRGSDLKNLLRNKKLYLVLDLDHTLLNSTRLLDISPEEEYLKSKVDSLQ
ncbi:Rna polymerase ii c-terminal domain phosphatase-like, partial [Thalictrum thalictroides]